MRQRTTVLFVVGVALFAVLASAVTAAATGFEGIGAESDPVSAATRSDGASPGQRLAGVIGAQRAEVEGEIETRTFGVRIALASSPRAKAGVVANQVNQLERRLDALRDRRAALERARENGSVSDGAYRAQVTELVVRIESTQRRINATDDVANDLPESDLKAAGVNQSNIAQLRRQATNLTDEESSGLVRSVFGDGVGEGMCDPSSSVLDSVDSGNFTAGGFVEGNENRTDAPGRRNGRGGENAGISRNGSAAPGTGANATAGANPSGDGAAANAGSGGAGADETATDETTVNETAANATSATTTRETPRGTSASTNETAAVRAATPRNATATTAGTPPNASGGTATRNTTATRNATATRNTTETQNATERSPTGASETPPTGTSASATETAVTDATATPTTDAPSNATATTESGTTPSRTANGTTAATDETAAGDSPNSSPTTSTNETGTAA